MAGIGKAKAPPQNDEAAESTPATPDNTQEDQAEPQAGQGIGAAMGADDSSGSGDSSGSDQGGDDSDPQPNVTPEEQAEYNEFVGNGMKLLYQKGQGGSMEVAPAVLAQLKGDWKGVEQSLGQIPQEEKPLDPKDPVDCLAVATVTLVLALEASAANSQKQLDPAVTFHGGAELLEQLADIDEAASIHDFTPDEMTGAAHRTAMLYGVSTKSMNKQEALSEFDHFLQTQGNSLGQSLGAGQGDQQDQSQGQPQQPAPQPDDQQQGQ